MTPKPPFEPGQTLVRIPSGKRYIGRGAPLPFKVHIVHYEHYDGWVVIDLYLNKFKASECILAEVYFSPLYQAMVE